MLTSFSEILINFNDYFLCVKKTHTLNLNAHTMQFALDLGETDRLHLVAAKDQLSEGMRGILGFE